MQNAGDQAAVIKPKKQRHMHMLAWVTDVSANVLIRMVHQSQWQSCCCAPIMYVKRTAIFRLRDGRLLSIISADHDLHTAIRDATQKEPSQRSSSPVSHSASCGSG
jgi:hypothetical protein